MLHPQDIFDDPTPRRYTDEEIATLWPQARGELAGFANALERGGSEITAEQLRMAIALADERAKKGSA